MNLRTRSARPSLPHLPEVVFLTEAENTIGTDIGHLLPQLISFIVILVDGRPQAVLIEPPNLGEQLPCVEDSPFLVIVAERPVTEHFKKGVMKCVVSHLFQIVVLAADANALL